MRTAFLFLYKNIDVKLLSNKEYISFLLGSKHLYLSALHIKLSSLLFSTQLLDLFAYSSSNNKSSNSTVAYYFFNAWLNKRVFLFCTGANNSSIKSITELFLNANWLEREAGELSHIFFLFKKDTRNLMLPYGDSSFPFKKSFPSIGYRELFYSHINQNIISSSISLQF